QSSLALSSQSVDCLARHAELRPHGGAPPSRAKGFGQRRASRECALEPKSATLISHHPPYPIPRVPARPAVVCSIRGALDPAVADSATTTATSSRSRGGSVGAIVDAALVFDSAHAFG